MKITEESPSSAAQTVLQPNIQEIDVIDHLKSSFSELLPV
jgi:hypothetical protein